MELQPARSDHPRQRPGSEARMGMGDERLRRESDDAHRPQRRDVSREPQQHRPGARRKNRQPHLGNARGSGSGAGLWRHSQHRDRAGQSVSADEQRAHGRAQRAHRRHPVGYAALRCQSSIHERRHRHRRQGAAGDYRLRTQHVCRWVLHQRHRYQHRKARVEVLHDSARRRAGLRHMGQASQGAASRRRDVDRGLVRSRFESHLLGNRAVEAVVVSQSRHHAVGQDAVLRTRRSR